MANEAPPPSSEPRPIGDFETGLKELEEVLHELENSELPLERSIALFERGMALTEACRQRLIEAETRVETITKRDGKSRVELYSPSK